MITDTQVQRSISRWRWVWLPSVLLLALTLFLLADSRSASAAEAEVPAPLANTVAEALAVWAQVATSGDSAVLSAVFVIGGPQHRLLDKESSTWNSASGLEPLRFMIRELRLRSSGSEAATVWASIEATRVGFESRILSWDFDLIRSDGRWKVWTVLAADLPETDAMPRFESSTTSATSTTAALIEEPSEQEHIGAQTIHPVVRKPGVRLPALSAWIIVITVIGVALAGYLAPRLDRGRER